MGKLLQIRVSAWTYREEDVVRAWPALTALAWPRPQYPDEKRGVLELVTALENGLSFEDWPQAVAEGLREGIGRAAAVKKDLEEALFQWEPRKANELSETLEEELATLNERGAQAPRGRPARSYYAEQGYDHRQARPRSPNCAIPRAAAPSARSTSPRTNPTRTATATVWTVPSGTASWCSRKRRRTAPST